MLVVGQSVFRSAGERAAWLLLCAWLRWIEDDEFGAQQCLHNATLVIAPCPVCRGEADPATLLLATRCPEHTPRVPFELIVQENEGAHAVAHRAH